MKAHQTVTSIFVIILIASLLFILGSQSYAADPYCVSAPSGRRWVVTFEDDFTKDKEIDKSKWNGGAGGTDWWNLDFHGKPGGAYMFECNLDGKPLEKPYTPNSSSTNLASGIYIFLLLDNDNKGADWKNNPFCVQYVRVWKLERMKSEH